MVCAEVPVLPQTPVVFLVHAYRVFECAHAPIVLGHVRIEIMDYSQAITTQFQRICQPADAILADVEGVLETVIRARVSVWYDHLGEPHTAEEGTAIIINMVEDQPLTRGES